MALTPEEQRAKDAGWAVPQGSDLISGGDDAIRKNATKARAAITEGDSSTLAASQQYTDTETAKLPTHEYVDERTEHSPNVIITDDQWRLAETDESGRISRAVDAEGRTWLTPHPDSPGVVAPAAADAIQPLEHDEWAWAVTDESGQIAMGVRHDGTAYSGGISSSAPYDVIVLAGQSNMQGAGRPLRDLEEWPAIWQYPAANKPQDGRIVPAVDPLQNPGPITELIAHGPGVFFAREYAIRHPGRRVLLVPAAYSGTAFSSDPPNTWDWTAGTDNLAVRAVQQTQAALVAAGPGARLAAILWHQGEGDSVDSAAPLYEDRLNGFIAWIRAQLSAPEVPFIVGQLGHERKSNSPGSLLVDQAHINAPAAHERAGFARSVPAMHNPGDVTHLSARGQILMGETMFAAWQRARFNTEEGTAPIGVENLIVRREGDAVHVAWDESWARVTAYIVEWSDNGTDWHTTDVEQLAPLSCEATIASTTASHVRVTAENTAGRSPAVTLPVTGQPTTYASSRLDISADTHTDQGWNAEFGPDVVVERYGPLVDLSVQDLGRTDGGATGNRTVIDLPPGFRPSAAKYPTTWRGARAFISTGGSVRITDPAGPLDYFSITYLTNDEPPEELP